MYYGRDFTRRLKKIKAELLALKQAHEYGLNRTDFYYFSKKVPTSASGFVNIRIIITFNMAETEMPYYIMQSSLDSVASSYGAGLWDSVNKRIIITGTAFVIQLDETNLFAYVASVREITSIVIEEI